MAFNDTTCRTTSSAGASASSSAGRGGERVLFSLCFFFEMTLCLWSLPCRPPHPRRRRSRVRSAARAFCRLRSIPAARGCAVPDAPRVRPLLQRRLGPGGRRVWRRGLCRAPARKSMGRRRRPANVFFADFGRLMVTRAKGYSGSSTSVAIIRRGATVGRRKRAELDAAGWPRMASERGRADY